MIKNVNYWYIGSLLVSLLVAMPIMTVFSSFFGSTSEYYWLLKNTFLIEYILSSEMNLSIFNSLSKLTKFIHASNENAFNLMDEVVQMSGEGPVVFRAISGDIDQISIWTVNDGFSRVTQGPSYEMKEFMESPLGESFFSLVEDLGLEIGSIRWKPWK